MPLVLAGATSGSATLQATDAQTVTLTLPASTGTLVVTGGAQTIEFADGSASAPSITNSGDTNTGMFFPAADSIGFTEGGAEIARFDSSGTFIVGPFGGNGNAVVAGSSSPSFTNQPGTNLLLKSGDGSGTGSSFMTFSTSPAGSSGTTVNTAAERMRIDSSGHVIVGHTAALGTGVTPNMQVKGTGASNFGAYGLITTNNEPAGLFGIYSNGENSLWIASDPDNLRIGSRIVFSVDGSDKASIDASGNLLVGTTSIGNVLSGSNVRFGKDGFGVAVSQYILSRNNGEAVDIQVATGESYSGILMANVSNASNATVATRIAYAIGCRGTSGTATALMTNNGSSGGYSFSVSFPSNGVVRITNTGGSVANIYGTFYCGIGS
jgi:hypothetical protein